MSFALALRRALPKSLKNFLRQRSTPWRISALLSPYLPAAICVDVGASYYPHAKWLVFLNAPRTHRLAVGPTDANLGYLAARAWPIKGSPCTTCLRQTGEARPQSVPNITTDSSIRLP